MVIFINDKGNAEIVTPEQVYQGSNNVTDITVIAPFSPQTVMHIGFILPNELYWTSDDTADGGARYMPMTFVEQSMTTKANVWKFVLPFSVTKQAGKVQIALNAVSDVTTGGATPTTVKSNCTSYLCEFTVQESVLPNLPSAPDPSVYELLTQYLGVLQGRTAVIPSLVAGVEKTAPNAFRTVSLGGAKGAEIVLENDLGKPLAPIGAASTVYLDGTVFDPDSQIGTWVPVYDGATVTGYTAVIPAAMHAQMRDGATARDLWVGFDEQANNDFTGVYQGYTVNVRGDITVSVKQPVAMNVRVWNGKGLSFTNIKDITPNGKDADGGNVYKILLTNGDVYYFTAPKGEQGVQGVGGTITVGEVSTLPPDSDATVVNVGTAENAVFNFGIPEGRGFRISKAYPSIDAMNAGYATDGVPLYGFVIIDTGSVEDVDNAKLYIKGETAYEYLTDMSGPQGVIGPPGPTGPQGIQGSPGIDAVSRIDPIDGVHWTIPLNSFINKEVEVGQNIVWLISEGNEAVPEYPAGSLLQCNVFEIDRSTPTNVIVVVTIAKILGNIRGPAGEDGTAIIDSELSLTSENAVQNKAITAGINVAAQTANIAVHHIMFNTTRYGTIYIMLVTGATTAYTFNTFAQYLNGKFSSFAFPCAAYSTSGAQDGIPLPVAVQGYSSSSIKLIYISNRGESYSQVTLPSSAISNFSDTVVSFK